MPAPSRMASSIRRDDSSDALYAATGGRFLVDDVASLARISLRRNSAPLMSYSTLESSASSSASRPFHVRPARWIGGAAGVSARGGFQAEGRMLTFQSIQSMPYALAQFPYRGVHRQQRRAFLVVRARVIGSLQPVPTPTRRAAAVSTARRLGRAARRARGSTADPFATARRSLRPRPPHRAVGTCLGDGAPRTGSLLVICEGAECAVALRCLARFVTPANFDPL